MTQFWLESLKGIGVRPVIIVPFRNPLEVAASLQNRDLLNPHYGHLLWLRHVLDAEYRTRKLPRMFISYDDFLPDWQSQVRKIENILNIKFSRFTKNRILEIENYISDDYRHHNESSSSVINNPELSNWLKDTYKIMENWSLSGEKKSDYIKLNKIRTEFNASASSFSELINIGMLATNRVRDVEQKLKKLENEHFRSEEEGSAKWRIKYFEGLLSPPAKSDELLSIFNEHNEKGLIGPIGLINQDSEILETEKVAIIIHIFYHDLWWEILLYLMSMRHIKHDLYITLSLEHDRAQLDNISKEIYKAYPEAIILECPNRGMDIGPFVTVINHIIEHNKQYDYCLKLHTKKSIIASGEQEGERWRIRLYEGLLGSPSKVNYIISEFKANPEIGMIGPGGFLSGKSSKDIAANKNLNAKFMNILANQLDISDLTLKYFRGSMFWCRMNPIIESFMNSKLTIEDFEPGHSSDMSKAHAMERIFACIIRSKGQKTREISTKLTENNNQKTFQLGQDFATTLYSQQSRIADFDVELNATKNLLNEKNQAFEAALKEIETLRDKFEKFANESNVKIANMNRQLDISTNKVVKIKNELMLNKEMLLRTRAQIGYTIIALLNEFKLPRIPMIKMTSYWEALNLKRLSRILSKSGIFDEAWYLEKYPDIASSGIDPATHYIKYGVEEKRTPNSDVEIDIKNIDP